MSAIRDLVRERFKAPVTPFTNRSASSVGLTAIRLMIQDPDRLGFWFVNLSVNTIFIGPFADVATTKGIRIAASGGNVAALWEEDFEVVAWEWFCIADAAGSTFTVQEYISGS